MVFMLLDVGYDRIRGNELANEEEDFLLIIHGYRKGLQGHRLVLFIYSSAGIDTFPACPCAACTGILLEVFSLDLMWEELWVQMPEGISCVSQT